ncbi:hypothetical protein D9619_013107 [Psilocybe cf. subviscida]|uniref:Uncharacterized protein n=1 Tax=Psilocybe cf. subviscida TaxID=2480587 RepID=A0A8H5AZP4_9AGAR|nr:hypothetical protein D9619_013107 [Psilocybe cf. subviscida]
MASTDATRPPMKRRKLVRTPSSPSVAPPPQNASPTSKPGRPCLGHKGVCASCHRGVYTTTAGSAIQCSVCSSTTCTVCSRTCTHSAASRPPTPFLTLSPTPSPSPTPSLRRFAVTLNMNLPTAADASNLTTPSTKRKKVSNEDVDAAGPGDSVKDPDFYGPGCGKVVCRKCCWEDIRNNTTTCFQCYGVFT